MKTNFKNLVMSGLLIFSLQLTAQESTIEPATQTPIGFKAEIEFDFKGEGDISHYTDKYNYVDAAEVFFNSRVVKVTAYKKQPDCSSTICNAPAIAPVIDYLDVKFVERIGCYDSYHAKSRDILSSQTVEKIIIHKLVAARCPNAVELPQATIYYKIFGVSNKTGELGSAWLMARLLNLQIVKL